MNKCKHLNKLQWSEYFDNGYGYYFDSDIEVCKGCDYVTIDGYTEKETYKRENKIVDGLYKEIGEEIVQKVFEELVLTTKEEKIVSNYSEEFNELTYLSMINSYFDYIDSTPVEELEQYEVEA